MKERLKAEGILGKLIEIEVKIHFNKMRIIYLIVECRKNWTFYENKCLRIFNESVGFLEAKQICESNDAKMISIHSSEENEFVMKLINESGLYTDMFWIGGRRNESQINDFVWDNGKEFNYSNWRNDSSGSYQEDKIYTQFYYNPENKTFHGSWDAIDQHQNNPSICERETING